MKKYLLASVCVAAFYVSPASAQSALNGFHVGANFGGTIGDLQTNLGGGSQVDLASTGIIGGASVGYMFGISSGWVGDIEGLFDYSTAKTTLNFGGGGGSLAIKQGIGYGGAGSVGYQIGGMTPYAKLGYMSSNFSDGLGGSKQLGGILGGAGLRYTLTRNWAVRAEYDYISYSSLNDTANGITVKPQVNILRIGADYKF